MSLPLPNLTPDMLALVDQEHADVRSVLDSCPQLLASLRKGRTDAAMFGRLIAIDCLCYSSDPVKVLLRLAAWDRLCVEHGA